METGDLFHPIRLTSQEAYTLLKSVPDIEASGIKCRVPNWWKKKYSSVKINVNIGEKKPSLLGFESILSAQPSLIVNGHALTKKEINELLKMEEGLGWLKGQWVEINHNKLQQLLEQMEKYDGTILFVSHDRMFLKKMATRVLEMGSISKVYDLNYEEYLEKKASNELVESVAKIEKEVKPQTVSFTDLKAIKNRVAKLEVLLEEAEQDLEAMRELRYEPEYYQDYRKMEELDAKIDDKHNEIAALMQEWEEKMAMLE